MTLYKKTKTKQRMNVFISPFTTKNNLRINIAAKVFKKLDFALGKEES